MEVDDHGWTSGGFGEVEEWATLTLGAGIELPNPTVLID
jgi:hypothetical protein